MGSGTFPYVAELIGIDVGYNLFREPPKNESFKDFANRRSRRSSVVTGDLFVFGIPRTSADFHEEGTLPWEIEALNIDDDGEQRMSALDLSSQLGM